MRRTIARFFSLSEAKNLIALGIPVYIAQMANTGMGFVDTVMTGQASATDMAAVAVAGALWWPVAIFGLGVLIALSPLAAQAVGAGQKRQVPHLIRQGIWCAGLLSLPLMAALYAVSHCYGRFGLEPELAELAGGYTRAILWGLPGLLLFVCARSFLEGFSRTRPAMVVSVMGLLLNIPCNYVLIYGKLGFPALGAVGCGVATALCLWFMAVCTVWYARREAREQGLAPVFSPLWQRGVPRRVDVACMGRIVRLGLPSAVALLCEVSLFTLSALILAPLGTATVAGHQVAISVSSVLFVLPMSLGITTTIRVGHCAGAGQWIHARRVGWTALTLALGGGLLAALGLVWLRWPVVAVYGSDPAVLGLAAHLLLYLAATQAGDAVQAVGVGILRGYNDTRCISWICFAAYCVIGLPLGTVLARTDWLGRWGAPGFWLAFVVGTTFGAVCYMARVLWLQGHDSAWLAARLRR